MSIDRIAFVATSTDHAQRALKALTARYGNCATDSCEVIVALGGDGFMLQTQLAHMSSGIPVYGMNQGQLAF